MTPPELLLASLASCAAYYAAEYLKKRGLAAAGTRLHVTAEKLKNPARVDNFKIEVEAAVDLSPEDQRGVEEAVHRCLIHNTLLNPSKIQIVAGAPRLPGNNAARSRRAASRGYFFFFGFLGSFF